MIKDRCKRCGTPIEFTQLLAGSLQACPRCGFEAQVPLPVDLASVPVRVMSILGVMLLLALGVEFAIWVLLPSGISSTTLVCMMVAFVFLFGLCGLIGGWKPRGSFQKCALLALDILLAACVLALPFWPNAQPRESGAEFAPHSPPRQSSEQPQAVPERRVDPCGPVEHSALTLPLPAPALVAGWERVAIPDVGTIDIPPILEIQSETYRRAKEALAEYAAIPVSTPGVIIQQKGLNAGDPDAFGKYVRIMVETELTAPDVVPCLSDRLTPSQEELEEMQRTLERKLHAAPLPPVLHVYRPSVETVSGMDALCISYTRRVGQNPPALVRQYRFANFDRVHTLTVSYRLAEQETWEQYIPAILQSFRITSVRGASALGQ